MVHNCNRRILNINLTLFQSVCYSDALPKTEIETGQRIKREVTDHSHGQQNKSKERHEKPPKTKYYNF